MKFLSLVFFSLFLVHCGPNEPLNDKPSTEAKDLVVSSNSHAPVLNKIEFDSARSPVQFIEFSYRSKFNQTLRMKSPAVDFENGLKCALNLDFEWGTKEGKEKMDLIPVNINSRLEVFAGKDHILRATFKNMSDCGRVYMEFKVEPY